MGLDNYVPVMVRVKHFRADNAGKEILIKTDAIVSYEKEAAHFRAEIQIEGKVVSVAHSLATDLGDSKAFEKAETSSIGRALALLGYEADDSISDDESEERSEERRVGKEC